MWLFENFNFFEKLLDKIASWWYNIHNILNAMKELSVFVDESGDFGEYEKHAPYYIITMVLHDQSVDISEQIWKLNEILKNMGYGNEQAIHTEPLISKSIV